MLDDLVVLVDIDVRRRRSGGTGSVAGVGVTVSSR
jgi:hypothetical protein